MVFPGNLVHQENMFATWPRHHAVSRCQDWSYDEGYEWVVEARSHRTAPGSREGPKHINSMGKESRAQGERVVGDMQQGTHTNRPQGCILTKFQPKDRLLMRLDPSTTLFARSCACTMEPCRVVSCRTGGTRPLCISLARHLFGGCLTGLLSLS